MTHPYCDFLIAQDTGCVCCRKPVELWYYKLEYYVLPSRLKRKRHFDRERCGFYCRECFESIDTLVIRVDQTHIEVPIPSLDEKPALTPCLATAT